jgi:hypothetical protein
MDGHDSDMPAPRGAEARPWWTAVHWLDAAAWETNLGVPSVAGPKAA